MKEIKNGKIYDTDSSNKIASYGNGLHKSDFGYVRETLYQTENGNFFIVGQGGAKTKYSTRVSNGRAGGKDLIYKTQSEVVGWIENREIDLDDVDMDVSKLVSEA